MSGDAGLVITPPPATSIPAGTSLAVEIVVALQSAIYTYDGWTGPLYFGEEVKNPGREIPRSMVGGVIVMFATYGLALAASFKLRRREPEVPRPFRVPGYAIVPGLALVGAAGFLVAASIGDPRNSAWAIGLVALSWPVVVVVRTRLVRPTT